MNQRERVEIIKTRFPRYSKPIDSYVTHGDETGIMLRPAAAALLGRKKENRSERYMNIAARIDREFVNSNDLQKWLTVCGYRTKTAWIAHCLKKLQAEYAARMKGRTE